MQNDQTNELSNDVYSEELQCWLCEATARDFAIGELEQRIEESGATNVVLHPSMRR